MDPISMMLGSRMTEAMNRVMIDSSARMMQMAENMLVAGHEMKLMGKEMGKGENLDITA